MHRTRYRCIKWISLQVQYIELHTLVLRALRHAHCSVGPLCVIAHCSNYTQLIRMRCRSKYDALRHGGQVRRFARVKKSGRGKPFSRVSAAGKDIIICIMRHKAIPVINSPWKN